MVVVGSIMVAQAQIYLLFKAYHLSALSMECRLRNSVFRLIGLGFLTLACFVNIGVTCCMAADLYSLGTKFAVSLDEMPTDAI
jgi:hypothetical protein